MHRCAPPSLRVLALSGWACGLLACAGDASPSPGESDAALPEPPDLACGETAELESATPVPDEVDAIVELRCRKCHSRPTDHFAPMSLVTWEDFHAPSRTFPMQPVYEVVQARIEAERAPMPPIREPPLEDAELAQLQAWLQDCAPAAGAWP